LTDSENGLKVSSFVLIAIVSISTITYTNVFASEPADEPVKITAHKQYTDDSGLMHIIGIVENTGIFPIGFVHVKANLADWQGNLLTSYDTMALFRTVLPGYITPFDIPINDRNVGDRMVSYALTLRWSIVDAKPENFEFSGINAYTVTHWDPRTVGYMGSYYQKHHHHTDEPHAHSETSGYLTNTGQLTAKSVKVGVIWYDKEGKFYDFDWQYISNALTPGEKGRFVFMIHPKAMGFYSLIAESDDYVAMLKNNGEKMIPVYELVRPNMKLLSSSKISISEVKLVDENNQIISHVKTGQKIFLQPFMKNNLSINQKFISIYQIKDSAGTPVMLSLMPSEIRAGESIDSSILWIPENSGVYTLQIFLWESLTDPVPLGDSFESTINVSG